MWPNFDETSKAQHIRKLNKPRIIAGLLAEMDAAGANIILRLEDSETIMSVELTCEFTVPFEQSRIKIAKENVAVGNYHASALFAGQRIDFNLDVLDSSGNCAFPNELTLLDLRRTKRRAFGTEIQCAEITSQNAVIFATPIDFSQNSMALVSAVADPALHTGDLVDIKIRGSVSSRDVYGFQMIVHEVKRSKLITRILLGFQTEKSPIQNKDMRRTSRHIAGEMTIALAPLDSYIGDAISCTISDLSLTGLGCELHRVEKSNWLTLGLHVKIDNSPVYATIIWLTDDAIGLRLDALDESHTLNAWFNLLRQLRAKHSVHHSKIDELAGLFTESGLLKGSRRKVFGTNPGRFLPPERITKNPLLYHRIVTNAEDARIAGQVSMVRLTDDFWCLQEGTHNGQSRCRSYEDLLREIHDTAQELAATSILAPRYVGGLVHKAVRSSVEYLEGHMTDPANASFQLLQMSIAAQLGNFETKQQHCKISKISTMSAHEKQSIMNRFDPTLYQIFGGWNGDHPRLNTELSKLGPGHRAETVALSIDTSTWGLAYRLKSYYSLSATGVINSLFLIIRTNIELAFIRAGIINLVKEGYANGTDDLVIILDPTSEDSAISSGTLAQTMIQDLRSPKMFTFYVIDNLLNKYRT